MVLKIIILIGAISSIVLYTSGMLDTHKKDKENVADRKIVVSLIILLLCKFITRYL